VAVRVPTLVKDVAKLLPISPEKQRRVLVYSTGAIQPFAPEPIPLTLPELLTKEGFEVTVHTPDLVVRPADYDLVLYLLAEETLLTRGRIFFDWKRLTGSVFGAMHRHWHEIPTVVVSLGFPYYLYDAPRAKTYINAYGSGEIMQEAVVNALLGRAEFVGKSPVDPFCGLEQARF
jgi:beta-N-acetylhexosaminidase